MPTQIQTEREWRPVASNAVIPPDRIYMKRIMQPMVHSLRGGEVTLKLSSGDFIRYDGKPSFIPRGLSEVQFKPRIGSVVTSPEPAVPIRTPMEITPVPARLGMSVNVLVGASVAFGTLQAIVESPEFGDWIDSLEWKQTVEEDQDLMNAALECPRTSPQSLAQAIRAKTLTKTKTRVSESSPRWRIHGYSRR